MEREELDKHYKAIKESKRISKKYARVPMKGGGFYERRNKNQYRPDGTEGGNVYYERHINRMDFDHRKRYAGGGGVGEYNEVLKIKDISTIEEGDVLGYIYKEDGKTTVRDFGKASFFDEKDKWRGFDIDGYPFEFEELDDIIENKNNPEFELKDIENSGTYWSLYKKKMKKDEKYKVTGGGLAEPLIVSASSKDGAIKKAQESLRPVFGNVPKNRFEATLEGGSCGCGCKMEKGGSCGCGCKLEKGGTAGTTKKVFAYSIGGL